MIELSSKWLWHGTQSVQVPLRVGAVREATLIS
jgi:hypothetical protein